MAALISKLNEKSSNLKQNILYTVAKKAILIKRTFILLINGHV